VTCVTSNVGKDKAYGGNAERLTGHQKGFSEREV